MRYISYGMNCNLAGMKVRCPTARCLGPAILLDHRLKFRLHADIEPAANNYANVLLWDISDQDLIELDQLEGYPSYYTRKSVQVIHNNQLVDAFVYMMNDQDYERRPDQNYLDCCIQGYTDNNMPLNQLEEAYYSAIYYNEHK